MSYKLLLPSVLLLFITGCSLKPPMPDISNAELKNTKEQSALSIKDNWWEDFHDESLNTLVADALKNSSNLELLRLNLQKAKQVLKLQNASYYPTLSFDAKASKNQISGEGASHTPQMTLRDNSIRALLSYEVDLWGRVKNSAKAAKTNFIASKYDYFSAKTSYIANLASTYFSLIALNQQKEILEKTIKNYQGIMDFRKIQLDEGAVNEVVFLQSKAEHQSAQIKLSNVNKNIASTQSALAILSSKNLDDIINKNYIVGKILPNEPEIPSKISSHVLKKRADVASAYKKIQSANFLVGVAKSQYYPTLSLTGALGFQSEDLNRLFTSNASIWSLAGSLAGKIFDFGRTDAKVELAKLEQNSTVIAYEQSVKNALFEARNALIARKYAKETKKHLQHLIKSLEKIHSLSNDMYQEGYTTHLELLDSQRTLLDTKVEYVNAKLALIQSVVNIYQAFGGGFEPLEEK